MSTYSLAVMWIWTGAVLATLVGLALAWRAVARADAAVVALGAASDGAVALSVPTAAVRDEVAMTAQARADLTVRSVDPSR